MRLTDWNNDLNFVWSGIIAGRTGCESGVCKTADCGVGQGGCKPGTGFQQPATQAEMTLIKNDHDVYDVEVINGINIPISMEPTNAQPGQGGDAYNCGAPGSKHPTTDAGSCSWNFNPPSNDYIQVTAGGNGCNDDGNCGGSKCGISFNPGHQNLF